MLEAILTAAICVSAIGLLAALVLVLAARFMAVKENPLETALRACLPGAGCGACGYPGCDGYAAALASGAETRTNLCTPGADAVSLQISNTLGVEFQDTIEQVATVHCRGDCTRTSKKAIYSGVDSCKGAKMLYGGEGACVYGCLGKGDCVAACPYGAVTLQDGIAHVNARLCIGCGLCAKACPNHIIRLTPDVARHVVVCSNKDRGAAVRKTCSGGCLGCKLCERGCPEGAITVTDNLAQIDYEKCSRCGKCVASCPSGCIVVGDLSGRHRFPKAG